MTLYSLKGICFLIDTLRKEGFEKFKELLPKLYKETLNLHFISIFSKCNIIDTYIFTASVIIAPHLTVTRRMPLVKTGQLIFLRQQISPLVLSGICVVLSLVFCVVF